MNRQALSALLRRKIILQRKSDELAEGFARAREREVRGQLSGFFGQLHTRITTGSRYAALDMLKGLDVRLDLSDIYDIYEKTAADTVRYIAYAKKLLRKADIEFVFNELDEASLEMIRNSFFWMQSDHTDVLIEEVKRVIEAAFAGEIAREELAKYLEDKFGSILNAESRYFKDVSDHIISQGQNMARVAQGSKYDVKYYQVMARMDERTTKFCRSINGKIITAARVERQSKKILAATNSTEKKNAAAWPRKDGPFDGKKLPANVGIPPYHYRCRTILQPYWPEEGEMERVLKSAWGWWW